MLSQEQKDELKRLSKLVNMDLLDLIERGSEKATAILESLGIDYKTEGGLATGHKVIPPMCDLSAEQRQQLARVGRATGTDLLGLVCNAQKPGEPEFTAHKPEGGFWGQFKAALAKPPQRLKLALVPDTDPQPAVDTSRWEHARQAASGGAPDMRPLAKAVKSGKPSELSPSGEAIAQQVARILEPQFQAIRDAVAGTDGRRQPIAEHLADAARRLDVIQGLKLAPVGFLASDSKPKGTKFNWAAFDNTFVGRARQ